MRPTQISIEQTREHYHAMKVKLRSLTADERRQEEVVAAAAQDARNQRKELKRIQKEKRTAEDDCERYRAENGLEA